MISSDCAAEPLADRRARRATLSRRELLLGLAAVAGAPLLLPASRRMASAAGLAAETGAAVRTVRLRSFQGIVRDSLRGGAKLDRAARSLFEMTRVDGFIVDVKNRDVLLFGQVDPRFPPLRLSDLVTAARNVWLPNADPACSIDPRQEDLAAVMRILAEGGAAAGAGQMHGILDRVQATCRRPQQVSVFGVPLKSPFAQTMVRADYHMKQVAAGFVPHPANRRSFRDLGFEWMSAQAQRDCGRVAQAPVMARFWFHPATPSYEQADNIFAIKQVGVRLLTEAEHLLDSGQRVQTGQTHPVADQFRQEFTASYREAARKAAIYAELRNLYRMVALAIFLKNDRAFEKTGLDLDLWLHDYPENRADTPERLAGVFVVKQGQMTCPSPGGTLVGSLWMPMCGGVSVARAVLGDPASVARGGGRLESVVQRVLASEPWPGHSLFWDARLPGLSLEEL